jgi:hypothetical protein
VDNKRGLYLRLTAIDVIDATVLGGDSHLFRLIIDANGGEGAKHVGSDGSLWLTRSTQPLGLYHSHKLSGQSNVVQTPRW